MISAAELEVVARIKAHGILRPIYTYHAAQVEGVDLPSACAMLMMETGGGRNEFGHDWAFAYEGQEVTEARYRYLRELINQGKPSTGVGPCQLTSVGLLNEADKLGGAWDYLANLYVGFHYLKGLQDQHGIQAGFVAYNGAGPAAEQYGSRAMTWRTEFATIIR